MLETTHGNLYDFPKYYDIVFGSDWKAEFDFLQDCFQTHAKRSVQRLFEPACGTGRLMVKLAGAGYSIAGNDLNDKAVDYCNARLERQGFEPTAVVGDMADFRLPRKVDAAFNMINSFRHLPNEQAAQSHLECVAGALARGGLYVLGLHLTPVGDQLSDEESWSARRGHLAVISRLWSAGINRRRRVEKVRMTFDIHTPSRSFRLANQMDFRTYTARQMQALVARVDQFEVAETYDFAYDIENPVSIGPETEDVVYVLRKL
jgi:SAM-dependent methyltransferase